MKMVTSDKYQCVAASFAMVFGIDLPKMLEYLGHDGLGNIATNEPHPNNQRSFHPQEFVDLCLNWDYGMTMIELYPLMKHGSTLINHAEFLGEARFFKSLLHGSGVLFGKTIDSETGHAVAWDENTYQIYDPRGRIYKMDDALENDFTPLQFFLLTKNNQE